MSRQTSKPPSKPQLSDVIPELLMLILEQVNSARDLLSLCLVSSRLYIHTVPRLYRNMNFDLSRPQHHQLLHRLSQDTSLVSKHIRILSVTSLRQGPINAIHSLYTLLTLRLTNLQQLTWNGTCVAPRHVLDTLSSKFPKAQLLLTSVKYFDNTEIDFLAAPESAFCSVLAHPASSLLTSLEINGKNGSLSYQSFKIELFITFTRSRALRNLRLRLESYHPHNSSMLGLLQGKSLPRLQELYLDTPHSNLFTIAELEYWGAQGGWDDLTSLTLIATPTDCFLRRSPYLKRLMILSHHRDHSDLNNVYSEAGPTGPVFASLHYLHLPTPLSPTNQPFQKRLIP
jgi:hypothetical protein